MAKTSKSSELTEKKDKRLDNLIPFEKGQSGNPEGKEKGCLNFKTIAKKWLSLELKELNELTGKEENLNQYAIMIIKAIKEAKEGSVQHLKTLLEYLEEKPKQTTETISTEPMKIVFENSEQGRENKAMLEKFIEENTEE